MKYFIELQAEIGDLVEMDETAFASFSEQLNVARKDSLWEVVYHAKEDTERHFLLLRMKQ